MLRYAILTWTIQGNIIRLSRRFQIVSSQQQILEYCAPHLARWVPPEFHRYIEPHARSGAFFTYLRDTQRLDGHHFLLLSNQASSSKSAELFTPGNPFQAIALSEPHDFIFFARPDSGLPLTELEQLMLLLSAKGCYVMVAPVSPRHFDRYFSEYLARPLAGNWLTVTNWDPDLFA